jgi:Carboxypeptidase regulatory-like domain
VQDTAGIPVVGASVEMRIPSSNLQRNVVSDAHGTYMIEDLPPGRCEVAVTARSFVRASAEVMTAVSTTIDIAVRLDSLSFQESVTARARGSSITEQPIDLTDAVHQSVITDKDLGTLLVGTRSFANIAYLAPGTVPVEPSDSTKARITAVSTGGSSGLNNDFLSMAPTTPTTTSADSCRILNLLVDELLFFIHQALLLIDNVSCDLHTFLH